MIEHDDETIYLVIVDTYGDFIAFLESKGISTWEGRKPYKNVTDEYTLEAYGYENIKVIFGKGYEKNTVIGSSELDFIIGVHKVDVEYLK